MPHHDPTKVNGEEAEVGDSAFGQTVKLSLSNWETWLVFTSESVTWKLSSKQEIEVRSEMRLDGMEWCDVWDEIFSGITLHLFFTIVQRRREMLGAETHCWHTFCAYPFMHLPIQTVSSFFQKSERGRLL